MRITRDFILKFTHEAIERRSRSNRDLLAAALFGSFLGDEYLIGNAADIDLLLIHTESPPIDREVLRMTDDVHLDICHHDQRRYRDTRRLRVDPWLGPILYSCKILHDPQHFLDFLQASVRGQYDRPDQVFGRARPQADQARELWFAMQGEPGEPGPQTVRRYLSAIEAAIGAIASLTGAPLSERRFLLDFPVRAEALSRPGLYPGLLGLLGTRNLDPSGFEDWVGDWTQAFRAAPETQARFHPARLNYYLGAFRDLSTGERPFSLLWLLITTWTDLVGWCESDAPQRSAWQNAMERLGLYGDQLADRLPALDAYLDLIEEALEVWARENGVWENL